ncbi:hypothetical protein AKJ16_DCAP03976 [Drosera capensis]
MHSTPKNWRTMFLPSFAARTTTTWAHYRHWPGLHQWRTNPINPNRHWGPTGPQPPPPSPPAQSPAHFGSLAEVGRLVLTTADPMEKSRVSHFGFCRYLRGEIEVGVCGETMPEVPARPERPRLVPPKEIPAPKDSGLPLNAYMLHNLAHVELNAIDLAWDTVVRFSPYRDILGDAFFADFAHVADDESRHFAWCSQRLLELGFRYGDMPAHNMLWRECQKSSDDVSARLAAIPLVQEARGLDAGPRLVKKLVGFGDHRTADIVARIADEEVAHVAVGFCWFISVCERMGRVPCSAFKDLLRDYNLEVKGPFNYSARDEVGLPRHWYDASSADEQRKTEQLSEVYERLTHIISMESENASMGNLVFPVNQSHVQFIQSTKPSLRTSEDLVLEFFMRNNETRTVLVSWAPD